MDFTTVLVMHLHELGGEIGIADAALGAPLTAVTVALETAVPSYVGMQLTVVERGHPVTLTAISTDRTTRTSLRLPLRVLGPRFDPESRVVLYAGTPGAFVDLAADLRYALHQQDCEPRIILDADGPPSSVSGVSGLYELSTINRAIGVLIGRGHHPDHAGETLRRDAARQGIEPHAYAVRLLGRPAEQLEIAMHDLRP